MRDINRIEPLLDNFKELWLKHSDLRFGQLVYILANEKESADIFNLEDDKWLERIQNRLKSKEMKKI